MGPPPIKKTKRLAKASLDGEADFWKSKKGRRKWLDDRIASWLDKTDPVELVAVVSGTYVVYEIIKSTPELLAQAKSFLFTPPLAVAWPLVSIIINRIWGNQELTNEEKANLQKLRDEPDSGLIVKSFFISYLTIKHSGQIINGVGNITGFIAGFLSLKVV